MEINYCALAFAITADEEYTVEQAFEAVISNRRPRQHVLSTELPYVPEKRYKKRGGDK